MKLTTQELEQMRSVDIGAVAAESLPDVSGMTFDNALSRKERISRFLQTVKNPYCFCIGGVDSIGLAIDGLDKFFGFEFFEDGERAVGQQQPFAAVAFNGSDAA